MNKLNLSKIVKGVQVGLTKHSSEILTGIGIAGMITTTILAVKATPKALELIEERRKEWEMDELSPIDTIKVAWKPYIPAMATGVASVACLIGASSVNMKRNAALATAYKLSETAFSEYKEKVVETIGEKKEEIIKDKVAKSKLEKDPVSKSEVIIISGGKTLCYDSISGRYFESDIEKIKRAVNELNRRMIVDMYISLSEFYDELGLNHTSISDELGWNLDDGSLEVYFSSQIADNGTPCIVLNYCLAPKYNYNSLV